MRALFFSRSGLRTGVVLAFGIICVQIITAVCAQHDWRAATNLLTIVSLLSLIIALMFGFTANIGFWGRVLWLAVVFAYMAFLGVEAYRFFFGSPNTPG
jgi:hypothetical protein